MKYRCLTDDELQELETEFKQFLIANNVYTEEWEGLNKKNDGKVRELVELFSDIVMEKALKNIKFLEHTTPKDIKSFKCGTDQMTLIGVTTDHTLADFTKEDIEHYKQDLKIFKTTKPYHKQRELEVFELLESGCEIIGEERFKKLELAYTYSKKTAQN